MNRILQDKNKINQKILFRPVHPVQFFFMAIWKVKRPLDSADASLGVTGPTAVIQTGATNAVRSGTEESQENKTLIKFFLDRMKRILQDKIKIKSIKKFCSILFILSKILF